MKEDQRTLRDTFLNLLSERQHADAEQVSKIVKQLIDHPPPFSEHLLKGAGRVVYTEGASLWQLYTSPGRIVAGRANRASQSFDPDIRSVVNWGEIFRPSVFITATGTYAPRDSNSTLPKLIDVEITCGALHLWGKEFPLPIRGKGEFLVEYIDDSIRIFRSPSGARSVQVREDMLERIDSKY